jgi:hypothetical protein
MPLCVPTTRFENRRTLSVAARVGLCEYARLCFTPAAG